MEATKNRRMLAPRALKHRQAKPRPPVLRRTKKTTLKVAPQTGIMAPKTKTSNAVQMATRSLDMYSSLSPQTQFEMTALRPGEFQTPYVEANGIASKLPTMIINGNRLEDNTGGETLYTLVTVCPMAAGTDSNGTGSTGVGYLDGLNLNTSLNLANARGMGYTDLYGTAMFASRITPYATRLEIKLEAADAMISGVAYRGCIPLSSFIGIDVDSLIKGSTDSIDLKRGKTMDLKASVNSRSLIHYRPPVTLSVAEEFADEWVSYLVFEPRAVRSLTTGNPEPFQLALTAHSNAVWWPATRTPSLNGLVSKVAPSTAPDTLAQDSFKKVAESYLNSPQPFSFARLKSLVPVLLSAASSIPGLAPWVSAASGLASLAFSAYKDPIMDLPDYSGVIADLKWTIQTLEQKYGWTDPVVLEHWTAWETAHNDLISFFQTAQDKIAQIRVRYRSARQVVKTVSGVCVVKYLDPDMVEIRHTTSNYLPNSRDQIRSLSRETGSTYKSIK